MQNNRIEHKSYKGNTLLLFILFFLSIFNGSSFAVSLEELEKWSHDNFWGHYTPPESLETEQYISMACGDWQVAAYIFAAKSFVRFNTIDSALLDISYCIGKSGDINDAEEALLRAEKIYSAQNSQVAYMDAMLEIWSGNPDRARRILRAALKKQKTDYKKKYLQTALGIANVLSGNLSKGFKWFRIADDVSKAGTGTPDFEARIFGQSVRYGSVIGSLYVRQYFGRPSVILRIRPIFKWSDGSQYNADPLTIEQVSQIFSSPYFQLGTERTGEIVIPRWQGIPVGGEIDIWIVHLDENETLDSNYVVVSGRLRGFPPADSFDIAVKNLRKNAIRTWFDTLMVKISNIDQPFWHFILSYRISSDLADSSRWDEGINIADSLIGNAPFLRELYLWRGAFSLFEKNYDEAYRYFIAPLHSDSCDVNSLFDAGIAKYFLGEYDVAESLWLRSIDCDEDFAPPQMALGVLYQDKKFDYNKAKKHYLEYLKLSDFLKEEVESWLQEME